MTTKLKSIQSNNSKKTGIGANARTQMAKALSKALADTYTLYLKTQFVHWNVTGPLFKAAHDLTEQQYTAYTLAIDELAERIRALGHFAPGSLKEFSSLTEIKEMSKTQESKKMVATLAEDNETLARVFRDLAEKASDAGDQVTEDMSIQRITEHEKNAWMLSALAS